MKKTMYIRRTTYGATIFANNICVPTTYLLLSLLFIISILVYGGCQSKIDNNNQHSVIYYTKGPARANQSIGRPVPKLCRQYDCQWIARQGRPVPRMSIPRGRTVAVKETSICCRTEYD